jgi:uncharacterized protein (TIGR03437 family)
MKSSVVLLWIGLAHVTLAQSPGTFKSAASMITPRGGHTATLLPNGTVLFAGGSMNGFPTEISAAAELYNPDTETFTPTGNMTAPRSQHSATLLGNGKVLIAGGRTGTNGLQNLGTAELYDPATGTFTPAGAMITVRGRHSATLLADGRVLMTACAIPCNSAIAELYDPITGVFTDVGTPGAGGDAAALLADGRVLITGGCLAVGIGTKAQLFVPATGRFIDTSPMNSGCANTNTATLLTSGKVLFAGNSEYTGPDWPADADLYDPAAGTFNSHGYMIGSHEFSTATLLPDATVLIAGSQLPGGNGDSGAELYTPMTGKFALAASMSTARHSHTATLLPDGSVLIAGGYSVWPGAAATSAELYRPSVLIRSPVLYSLSGDGRGQGAILRAGTAQTASPDHPASVGEALEIYFTGLTDASVIPPQVSIGGRMAAVLWFGNTPGFVGLNQINVRVPSGIASGPAVPVRLHYLGRPTNEVTIAVQ